MESLDAPANFVDSLLSFLSNMEDCNDEQKPRKALSSSLISNGVLSPDDPSRSSHEFVEEDLEWISNKDAFPALETFVDVLSDHPRSLPKQQSPVSVLESSTTSRHSDSSSNSNENCSILISCCGNLKPPRRARSKRRLRRRQICCISQPYNKKGNANEKFEVGMRGTSIGRKCQHCGVVKTPQWREGPLGPKTLCNACGVRYKSGRLVPEYRPANSPTFTSKLHSNSHRKVMEMRRLKQMMGMGMGMVKPVETV